MAARPCHPDLILIYPTAGLGSYAGDAAAAGGWAPIGRGARADVSSRRTEIGSRTGTADADLRWVWLLGHEIYCCHDYCFCVCVCVCVCVSGGLTLGGGLGLGQQGAGTGLQLGQAGTGIGLGLGGGLGLGQQSASKQGRFFYSPDKVFTSLAVSYVGSGLGFGQQTGGLKLGGLGTGTQSAGLQLGGGGGVLGQQSRPGGLGLGLGGAQPRQHTEG